MAASFTPSETYGASGAPTTADITKLNLLSTDTASGADTTTNTLAAPITVPGAGSAYSYERWTRGHWTGTFTQISAVTFWKSNGTPGTGLTLNAGDKGNQTYVTPVVTASSVATAEIPATQGAGLSLAYATNYCDYIVLQLVVGTTETQGYMPTITYSFGWNEI